MMTIGASLVLLGLGLFVSAIIICVALYLNPKPEHRNPHIRKAAREFVDIFKLKTAIKMRRIR